MSDDLSTYSFGHASNYVPSLNCTLSDILEKYDSVIREYLKYSNENLKLENSGHQRYITLRGFDTITHVFRMTLSWTNNIHMAYYHAQKAFYFYVEFISQTTSEPHDVLHLTSRDAITFVYKKTIYEALKTLSQNTIRASSCFDVLDLFVNILRTVALDFRSSYTESLSQQMISLASCNLDRVVLYEGLYYEIAGTIGGLNIEESVTKYVSSILATVPL